MSINVEAVYENGVLKPCEPLPLKEHERVELLIRTHVQELTNAPAMPPERLRQLALDRLLSYQLPVADWNEMEQEIIRGAAE